MGRDRDLLTVLGIAFGALVVIQVAVTAVRAWVGVYLSTNINLKLLTTLFNHMLRLPLAWFEKRNIGDIVSKFRSVDAIQRTLTTTFVETVVDGLMVVLTLVVMGYYSLHAHHAWWSRGRPALRRSRAGSSIYPQRYATDEQLAHEARSRHALHRDAARDDGDQAEPARGRAALGLPEPGGGPDQRRRAGAERGHPAARRRMR